MLKYPLSTEKECNKSLVIARSINMTTEKGFRLPTCQQFDTISCSRDGSRHCLAIHNTMVYSWGANNNHGQLGRSGNAGAMLPVKLPVPARRVFSGGFADSGHSAVLDAHGNLWVAGCDRWQQLGLGSSTAGAAGYTWAGGAVFHTRFQVNKFIGELVQQLDSQATIRDVALGGDHSVVLSSNMRDVLTFGKGGEGQLGSSERRFLSAPMKSMRLSSGKTEIHAVCAFQSCSLTLDRHGELIATAGKCRRTHYFIEALTACRSNAKTEGLLD